MGPAHVGWPASLQPTKTKHLVRPLLATSRREIEAYLKAKGQCWREDSSNLDLGHTRNRIRHTLLPLLEREFNPAIRQTLADLAELAQAEDDYWNNELSALLPRLIHEGKPSRSGRSSSGDAQGILALDLAALRGLPLAVQRQVIQGTALRFGVSLEFKHIQQLTSLAGAREARCKAGVAGRFSGKSHCSRAPIQQKHAQNHQRITVIHCLSRVKLPCRNWESLSGRG